METPAVVAAIRLLMLTGCRLGEIRTLRWEDVDLDAAELRWRDAKSGAKMIPLNGPALEVLANAVRIEGNPYVIVGAGEGAHLTDLRKPWWRVRKAAGLEESRETPTSSWVPAKARI